MSELESTEPVDPSMEDAVERAIGAIHSRMSAMHAHASGVHFEKQNNFAANSDPSLERLRSQKEALSSGSSAASGVGAFFDQAQKELAPAGGASQNDPAHSVDRVVALHNETLTVMREFAGHLQKLSEHHDRMIGEIQSLRSWNRRVQIQGMNRFSY